MKPTKRFYIKCTEDQLERFVEAPDVANAVHAFASKYYRSFYPPFVTESGQWCVSNSLTERYFSVREVN